MDEKARTILAVEDNPDTLTLLRYMLKSRYGLVLATKVDEALERVSERPFDLFILDINLGDERTGIDLLRLLRERPGCAVVPALALTAYAMPGDKERFLQAGFEAYISKPFTQRELLQTIEDLLVNDTEPRR
jgi:CheY-like chemotaxis protein